MADDEQRTAELVRLVERDYDQTTEFIRSVVGTTTTIRGWAITVWLAVIGVAIERGSWELSLFAVTALLPFAFLDAYHSWLYSQALRHARALEDLSAAYYRAVERGEDDEDILLDFEASLAAHTFGMYSHFRRFEIPELRAARPRAVFFAFYPGLATVGLTVVAVIAVTN